MIINKIIITRKKKTQGVVVRECYLSAKSKADVNLVSANEKLCM